MDTLWQDLNYAMRSLRRSPGFALAAIFTLALGIGANAAIFTIAKRVVLDPMPFPESERMVAIHESNPEIGLPRFSVSPPNYVDFRDRTKSFEAMAAVTGASFNLTADGSTPERLAGVMFTSEYFDVYRVRPQAPGRVFTPEEDRPGAPKVVILNHGFWQRRFAGDPGILDSTLILDGEAHTVIGIMPPGFQENRDVFAPLAMDFQATNRGAHYLAVRARLAPGIGIEKAAEDLATLAGQLAETYPDSNTGWTTGITPLRELVVEDFRPKVLLLVAVVGLVLLIACANVANLFLTRLASRERELAVRSALGAGRRSLIRAFMTESTLLATAGGVLGVVFAWQGTRILANLSSLDIPRAEEISIDGGVLLFALALSIAAGLVFGLVPALQMSRPSLNDSLKEGGRGQAGSSTGLLRRGLVVAEVSLAVLPLVGALLLLKSFSKLTDVDPGFEPGGALTAQIDLPRAKYTEAAQQAGFYGRLTERLASLPGVEKVGAVTPMPLTGRGFVLTFYIEGEPLPEPNKEPQSNIRVVNDDYFDAMQIPLRRGRFFNRADAFEAPNVAVINVSCLTRFFPDQDPLGQRITFDDPEGEEITWMTIVGVVGDVHHESLAEATDPEIYWSYAQRPMSSTTLVLRTAGPTTGLAAPLRSAVAEIDSELPIYRVRALQDIVDHSVAQPRFTSLLWGLFAGLALLLAVIGVYSVLSYTVNQRMREIGVRLALGAERFEILQMILRGGMSLVVIGLAAGLLAAFLASNLLQTMVYGISPNDTSSFALAAFVLASVGVLACVIPALRATRVDPVVVLRNE